MLRAGAIKLASQLIHANNMPTSSTNHRIDPQASYASDNIPRHDVHWRVSVRVLMRDHRFAHWAHRFRCPSSANISNATESCLGLKHESNRYFWLFFSSFFEQFRQFFQIHLGPENHSVGGVYRVPICAIYCGAKYCRRSLTPWFDPVLFRVQA